MSGLGFIIQNADFSGSPLGSVSFKKTPVDVVDDYLALVGADNSKKEKLVTLYRSLGALGVLDKIDIFPMLGSSLTNKLIGLKPSGEETYFNTLLVGDNASNATSGLTFSDTNPNVGSLTPIEKQLNDYHGTYMFCRMKGLRAGMGVANAGLVGTNAYLWIMTGTKGTNTTFGFSRQGTKTDVISRSASSGLANISSYVNSDIINNYFNGELWITEVTPSTVATLKMNNIFGAQQGDANSHYFNADVEFFAIGSIAADKVLAVDAVFREYFD